MKLSCLLLTLLVVGADLGAGLARAQPNEKEDPNREPVKIPSWQVSAEYMLWRFRGGTNLPVVTSGSVNDPVPGALGQPGTTVLSTEGSEMASSGRFSVLFNFDEAGLYAIDASYMIVAQTNSQFNAASDGSADSQVLTRPFFNPVANREDADPRTFPNVMAGTVNHTFNTRIQGAESNFHWNTMSPGGTSLTTGLSASALFGVRWLQIKESFISGDTVHDIPAPGNASPQDWFISDTFAATNNFLGGQVGFGIAWNGEYYSVEVATKLVGGVNFQTINIDGFTSMTSQITGVVISDRQGLFAQRSNIGTYTRSAFSFLPELDVKVTVQVLPNLRVKLGYSLLSLVNAVGAADAIDRTVNIQPLLSPTQLGVARPVFPGFHESSFLMQGFSVGVELLF